MEIATPTGPLTLPDSVHNNTKCIKSLFRTYTTPDGRAGRLDVTIRWDDTLGNGHNSFGITGDLYEAHTPGGLLKWTSGGCLHDEVAKRFPELVHAIPYHLFSSDGPLHYFANTTYLAGDIDHWGARKGEQRRGGKSSRLVWQLPVAPYTVVHSDEMPADYIVEYEPVFGEGKLSDFEAARSCIKHLELTDEQLALPKDALRALLLKMDSGLNATTVDNVAYLAGDRDPHGLRAGEQRRNKDGLAWRLKSSPYTYASADEKPDALVVQYKTLLGDGKDRELDSARRAACWLDADDTVLMLPKADLEKLLAARLPALMASFKAVIEGLGFVY